MHAVRVALLLALAIAPGVARAGELQPVMINCGDAVGIPGGIASVTVSLVRNDASLVVGTENDLQFDDAAFSIQRGDCMINPAIGPGTDTDKSLQQSVLDAPPRVRAIVVSLDNVNVIPPGLLYTCAFRVGSDTPLGSYDVINANLVASTADGARLPVSGASCHIVVAAATATPTPAVTPTPTPRCKKDSDCPSGEVCVDGECVTATPTPTPIGFCSNDHDCPPGEVCVDHHCVTPTPTGCSDDHGCPSGEVCVNNHCVTPTPTPQCHKDSDCPSGQVCVDGTCENATPTASPTPAKKSGGGGGCNCEIDPAAPATRTADGLAVLLPALVLLLRRRSRRAAR